MKAAGTRRRAMRAGAICTLTFTALSAPVTSARPNPMPALAPAPAATDRIGRMGELMSETAARHEIAFGPFSPPRRILATALLPPFHGPDMRRNRGIAFEYAAESDRRYILAQWPANGGTIVAFRQLYSGGSACPGARIFSGGASSSGIVWSTPHGLIMTLQIDGTSDARTLSAEWRSLVRRGACR